MVKFFLFFIIVGCWIFTIEKNSEIYERGYYKGYLNGYEEGEKKGYQKGEKDGYKKGDVVGFVKGYSSGTADFIVSGFIPSLGLLILGLIVCIMAFGLYKYMNKPVIRYINKIASAAEYRFQQQVTRLELIRKRLSLNEAIRVEVHNTTTQEFAQVMQSLSDESAREKINAIRLVAEKDALIIRLDALTEVINEYSGSLTEIDRAKNLSVEERIGLYRTIKTYIKKLNYDNKGKYYEQ